MLLKAEDSRKWVNTFLVLMAALTAFLVIKFLVFIGLRFELEAKVEYYELLTQVVGVVIGLMTFIICVRKRGVVKYLDEVFGELLKVVWPDKESSVKITIVVVIGVAIISALLVLADVLFNKLLSYLY